MERNVLHQYSMERGGLYHAISALEEHQRVIGMTLIMGSIGGLWLRGTPEQQVYTITLQSTTSESTPRHIDFTKPQFQPEMGVETSRSVEMSNGDILEFRPTYYPLTMETKIAGITLAESTTSVEVAEVWVNDEKQGFFDFRQDKYVASHLIGDRADQSIVSGEGRSLVVSQL
ncbi:MAG: hypothetical protein HC865_21515 [Cyanobacteria bacterium RU_5_0]|nr:hypothetical protein [Cyanobacteria bacterium RU_5_0]